MPVQNKPIIHARDHETGGADPIRGLLPPTSVAGDYPAAILGLTDLRAYWRMGETTGDFLDTSGHVDGAADLDANPGTGTAMTRGVTGLLPEAHDDGAVAFNVPPEATGTTRPHADTNTAIAKFNFDSSHPTMSVIARVNRTAGGSDYGGVVSVVRNAGIGNTVGWALHVLHPDGNVELYRRGVGSPAHAATTPTTSADEPHSIGATYDGSLIRVYVDGVLAGSLADTVDLEASTSGAYTVKVGGYSFEQLDGTSDWRPFYGVVDEVAVFGAVLTDADMAGLHALAEGEETPPGWVPTPGPGGDPIWAPPGTEVEHGDGDPEEDPITSPPGAYTGTPENGAGWHLEAHFEYVVLYDSSPGRFDVPPRKWTRVPFNTVRLYRRWESTVDGNFVDAWLEDDRGLTEHARNGLLLVTPGMLFDPDEMTVSGWFSIEYPIGDVTRMPGYGTVHGAAYQRAARMTNTTNGSVLKIGTGWGAYKGFFEWPFTAADGDDANAIGYLADNPYPVYLPWAARPLNKPLPYPKLTNAQSLTRYQTPVAHEPGFRLDQMVSDAPLAAGDALSLQAWQDTPWLLRFGTDKYPPYTPYDYVQEWRKRPALVLFHFYDPDTVDHDTGVLL